MMRSGEKRIFEYSCNNAAMEYLQEKLIPHQKSLGIALKELDNGCKVLDMGVHERGGWRAGIAMAEVCMGGLGSASLSIKSLGGMLVPHVTVEVDHPAAISLCSHISFLKICHKGQIHSFSGPGRILARDEFSKAMQCSDPQAQHAVLIYQRDQLIDCDLSEHIAERLCVEPAQLYVLAAATGSAAGAVQISARCVEQVMPTLNAAGFAMKKVVHACGQAPITAIVDDEADAYGRVNDCLIYGQETTVYVDCDDEEIQRVLPQLAMDRPENEAVYGKTFQEIFALCGNDWAKVPRAWDSPSKVNIVNLNTGHFFSAGSAGTQVLIKSFYGKAGTHVTHA